MNSLQKAVTALTVTAAVGFGSIVAPVAANASRNGNRDGAIILGAAALALALSQNNHRGSRYRNDRVSYRYDDDCDRGGYRSSGYRSSGDRYDDSYCRDDYRGRDGYASSGYRDRDYSSRDCDDNRYSRGREDYSYSSYRDRDYGYRRGR